MVKEENLLKGGENWEELCGGLGVDALDCITFIKYNIPQPFSEQRCVGISVNRCKIIKYNDIIYIEYVFRILHETW